jgi:glycosyltransferase involved in cell wall biosynthesis
MRNLSIIIPAYNEEGALKDLLPKVIEYCRQMNCKLILVNDGSKDTTGKILDEFAHEDFVTVIHNKVNAGYGGAIKNGIKKAETDYIITFDADGQHLLEDIEPLLQTAMKNEAEMVVGDRGVSSGAYRETGKLIIRSVAKTLIPFTIKDINSGLKLYDRKLALKYIKICPDTIAYTYIILFVFIFKKHRVLEVPIKINKRLTGKSTINFMTAVENMQEIINIIILFNPIRIFSPIGLFCILISCIWEAHILLKGNGISVGSMLGFVTGFAIICFGLLANQISAARREALDN